MRPSNKVKVVVAQLPLRKSAVVPVLAAISSRRPGPTWISARECAVVFPGTTVTSRVRDGLVLRVVGKRKSPLVRTLSHGSGAR
jgi:hypothetical protein